MNNPFIIAEIGINHNSDLNIAKQLIDMAKLCGADAVKFQKRTIEKVYTKEFLDSPRQSPWGTTQREQKNGLEFGQNEYEQIDAYCRKVGIDWFASAWDKDSQIFLNQFDLKYNKIPHQMSQDKEWVDFVRTNGRFNFISYIKGDKIHKLDNTISMLVSPKYPCPDEECYLSYLEEMRGRVGYSCHNPSILVPSLAVSKGAEAIEVHITLDRTMYGSDQPASFEFTGLYYIVRDCKRARNIIGISNPC